MTNYFRIGKIISLHGIKGEVKVFCTTDIARFNEITYFYLSDKDEANDNDIANEKYEILNVKRIKNCVVLNIKGIDTIENATKLIHKNIYIERQNSLKLDKNEFYASDLINLKVVCGDKNKGTVKDILSTKANDIIEVEYEGKNLLIPLITDFIENIDVNSGIIKVKNIDRL